MKLPASHAAATALVLPAAHQKPASHAPTHCADVAHEWKAAQEVPQLMNCVEAPEAPVAAPRLVAATRGRPAVRAAL